MLPGGIVADLRAARHLCLHPDLSEEKGEGPSARQASVWSCVTIVSRTQPIRVAVKIALTRVQDQAILSSGS